jgi:2-polyprenyl-6-methoxyphenol hydroxylase-like FAD-dependent oxidoreductase
MLVHTQLAGMRGSARDRSRDVPVDRLMECDCRTDDLKNSRSRTMNIAESTRSERHALVIGGSMAGLLAARVLAAHFDRVTIVERDPLPEQPASRRGVPQARHNHVLLARGRLILHQLFPRLEHELFPAGAAPLDMAAEVAWLTPAGWGVHFQSTVGALACSRDLLEWGVRRQLDAIPKIHVLAGFSVDGLLAGEDRGRVAGVRVKPDDQSSRDQPVIPISASLVVDASGRGSRASQWLAELGYSAPEETIVNASLGYASRIFRRTETPRDWKGIYLQAAPPAHGRVGVLLPVEGNRWHVTIGGGDGDYPPTDQAGFLDYARSLRDPMLYEAIKDAEPLSPIYGTRGTENRLRHWESLDRRPEGLIVLGDAACAFNPVYGQGMTTAALGALELDACLQAHRQRGEDMAGFARDFQRRLAKVNAVPWMLATSEDLRYRTTSDLPVTRGTRMMHWYMDQVMALSTADADVRRSLMDAFNMLQPPRTLFHPRILLRVLGRGVGVRTRRDTRDARGSISGRPAPLT